MEYYVGDLLQCSYSTIKNLSGVVDHWMVDVKSVNPLIYQEYTGVESYILQHLCDIQSLVSEERVTIKVPYIPGFNDGEDLESDMDEIRQRFGFSNVYKVEYKKL